MLLALAPENTMVSSSSPGGLPACVQCPRKGSQERRAAGKPNIFLHSKKGLASSPLTTLASLFRAQVWIFFPRKEPAASKVQGL